MSDSLVFSSLLFAFALLDTGTTLFLLVYFVMTLSDLECDYLNSQECCVKLNMWVIPKLVAHALLTLMLLFSGHWLLTLCNLPLLIWIGREYVRVPKGNLGVYDPTEIHNRGQLKTFMRDVLIQIGFYLIFFFIYLYCLILSFLKNHKIERSDDIIS